MSEFDRVQQILDELTKESDDRYRVWLREHGCPEDRIESGVEARNEISKIVTEYLVHGEQPVVEWDDERKMPVLRPRGTPNPFPTTEEK